MSTLDAVDEIDEIETTFATEPPLAE